MTKAVNIPTGFIARTVYLPANIRLTPEKREEVVLDLSELPDDPTFLGKVFVGGARIVMTNAYNSGGKDVSESDRRSNVARRWASWKNGEYTSNGSGPRESIVGEMREAFVSKQVALGKTTKEADAMIRDAVTAAFGKDEKATFGRFLDAVATLKAKAGAGEYDAIRAELETAAMEAVEASRIARKEATDSIDIADIDLF